MRVTDTERRAAQVTDAVYANEVNGFRGSIHGPMTGSRPSLAIRCEPSR